MQVIKHPLFLIKIKVGGGGGIGFGTLGVGGGFSIANIDVEVGLVHSEESMSVKMSTKMNCETCLYHHKTSSHPI